MSQVGGRYHPGDKITVLQSGIGTAEPEFTIVIPDTGLEEPNTCLDNKAATGHAIVEYLYNIKKQLITHQRKLTFGELSFIGHDLDQEY